MINIAIFASGNGTNFTALCDKFGKAELPVNICLLVCDHPQAPVINKARERQIPVWTHALREFEDKQAYELAILAELEHAKVELLVLAGYMKIVTQVLLNEFPESIINIHPALLPAFPGRHGIEDAFNYGVKVTGVTVHYVDAGVDSGPIIAQQAVSIDPEDSVDSLATKIHSVEHELYFNSLCQVLEKKGIKQK